MKSPVGHPLTGWPFFSTSRCLLVSFLSSFVPFRVGVRRWADRWPRSRHSFVGHSVIRSVSGATVPRWAPPTPTLPAAPSSSSASRPFAKRQDGDRQALIAAATATAAAATTATAALSLGLLLREQRPPCPPLVNVHQPCVFCGYLRPFRCHFVSPSGHRPTARPPETTRCDALHRRP